MSRKPRTIEHRGWTAYPSRPIGGVWYWRARNRKGGQAGVLAIGRMDRDAAEARLAELVADRPAAVPTQIVTVGDLLDCWIADVDLDVTAGRRRPHTARILRWLAGHAKGLLEHVRADRLTAAMLEDAARQKVLDGYAVDSAREMAIAVRAAHAWALDHAYIDAREIRRLRLDRGPERASKVPTDTEIHDGLRRIAGSMYAPLIAVVAVTGCRPSEVAIVPVADLADDADGWGRFAIPDAPGAKTGSRVVYVEPWAWALLRAHAATVEPGGTLYGPHAASRAGEALKHAGVGWTMTDLRRAKSRRVSSSSGGVTEKAYAETMGHGPETALRHYQRTAAGGVREAHRASALGRPPRGIVVALEAATGSTPGIHTGADHDGDGIP